MFASYDRPWPKPCRCERQSGASAFTLVELMVVISVLALLAAIIVPSMSHVYELAYSTMCKNNLHKLAQAMRGPSMDGGPAGSGGALTLPDSSGWTGVAKGFGSAELLVCKKDEEEHVASADSLADYYLLQAHGGGGTWWVSNVAAILGMGDGVIQDPQIHYQDIPAEPQPHHGRHPCWCNIPVRKENEHLIAIQDEGMILVTFEGDRILIESIIGCGVTHCGSDHWLMKGDCTDGSRSLQEDEVVLRLGGNHYRQVDPNSPHVIITESASYGMNSLIRPTRFGSQQLMIMDAGQTVVQLGEPDWLETVKDRHLGKVNVVTVGGCVHSMSKPELYDEYLLYEDGGERSKSLWGPLACPRDRP